MQVEVEKKLQVPMSGEAYALLKQIAKARGFNSRAEYMRSLLVKDAPEFKVMFEAVEWGGNRRADKSG